LLKSKAKLIYKQNMQQWAVIFALRTLASVQNVPNYRNFRSQCLCETLPLETMPTSESTSFTTATIAGQFRKDNQHDKSPCVIASSKQPIQDSREISHSPMEERNSNAGSQPLRRSCGLLPSLISSFIKFIATTKITLCLFHVLNMAMSAGRMFPKLRGPNAAPLRIVKPLTEDDWMNAKIKSAELATKGVKQINIEKELLDSIERAKSQSTTELMKFGEKLTPPELENSPSWTKTDADENDAHSESTFNMFRMGTDLFAIPAVANSHLGIDIGRCSCSFFIIDGKEYAYNGGSALSNGTELFDAIKTMVAKRHLPPEEEKAAILNIVKSLCMFLGQNTTLRSCFLEKLTTELYNEGKFIIIGGNFVDIVYEIDIQASGVVGFKTTFEHPLAIRSISSNETRVLPMKIIEVASYRSTDGQPPVIDTEMENCIDVFDCEISKSGDMEIPEGAEPAVSNVLNPAILNKKREELGKTS
jgi:hypothetical protein